MQDLDAPNLIIGDVPLNELKRRQQEFLRSHPTFRPIYCNAPTFYLNKELSCQPCEAPTQYWSLESLQCVPCPPSSAYNPSARKCLAQKTPVTNL